MLEKKENKEGERHGFAKWNGSEGLWPLDVAGLEVGGTEN